MTPPGGPNAGHNEERERGRSALVAALIALLTENILYPSIGEIAARAGVAAASFSRYFEDEDELRGATAATYFEDHAHLLTIPNIGEGTLTERIRAVAESRIELYETIQLMARRLRVLAARSVLPMSLIHRTRATQTDQLSSHFDAELRLVADTRRNDIVTSLTTVTSFEAWDRAHQDYKLSRAEIESTWVVAMTAILSGQSE